MALPDFGPDKWSAIGEEIASEKQRRAGTNRRIDLERRWKEVDRQLAMKPVAREVRSGVTEDWYPNLEMPSQFNSLEVLLADARRLIFPRSRDWFDVSSYVSDEYVERFEKRRERFPMIGNATVPMIVNQQTADALVKGTFDHYHSLYNFRGMHDLCMAEEFKYGTSATAVREAVMPKFDISSRGAFSRELRGPVIVPYSIKTTYLDESPLAMLHEGFVTSGTTIHCAYKKLVDIKEAMKKGSSGWVKGAINNLDTLNGDDDKKEHVEVVISEGDHLFDDGTFLPDTRITVAVGNNAQVVIRYEDNIKCEMVIGHYIREHVDSAYGTSPLMKGQPLQEALSEGINRMMAAVALDAEPPIGYDRNDGPLAANGGPEMAPGAQIGLDDMDSLKTFDVANPEAHAVVVQFLKKYYEEVTGVNDPRRGTEVKSHTTASGNQIQAERGQARTSDYADDRQQGPLTSILYKEYDIIKRVLKTPQPMPLSALGIEGWVKVAAEDLPDRIALKVLGASGPAEERQETEIAIGAIRQVMELHGLALQMGITPESLPELKMKEISEFILQKGGINDAARVIGDKPDVSAEQPGGPAGAGGGIPQDVASFAPSQVQ